MEALVVIGGFIMIVAVGYFAVGRFGRFLDEGGISPYWDEAEERAAKAEKKEPAHADSALHQEGCNNSESKVV